MTPAKPGPSLQAATPVAQAKAVLRKKDSDHDLTVTGQTGYDSASQPVTRDAPGEGRAMNAGDAGAYHPYAQSGTPAAGASTSASTSAAASEAASPPATTPAATVVLVNDMFNPFLTGVGMLADVPAPSPAAVPAPASVPPGAPLAVSAPVPVSVAIVAAPAPAVPDTIAPTLAITSNRAALRAGQTATVTFTFSEAPAGFAAGDISITGGTLSTPTVSTTDPKVYTAAFTPTAGVDAAIGRVTVASGLYADAAGNSGGAGTTPALAIDTLAPAAPHVGIDGALNVNSNVINLSLVNQQYGVWGIYELGATVTFTIAGTTRATTPWYSNWGINTWQYTLTAADIAAMGQGPETLTATQTDAAGNTSAAGTFNAIVNTINPIFSSVGTNITVAENTVSSASFLFDATADADVGVTYSLRGPDAFQFNVDAATGVLSFKSTPNFEFRLDAGADNVYDVTIFATNSARNSAGQAVQVTVTDVLETNRAGDAMIDLGMYGKLIAPVQVEGKWYYFWDRNGSGSADTAGTINGGYDIMTHNVLDDLFNNDINGVRNTTDLNGADGRFGTTDNFRYATLNGVHLALPRAGGVIGPNGSSNYYPGTAVSDGNTNNPTYDDLLAIWDAYNGAGTGTSTTGMPAGWKTGYWSASVGNQQGHALVGLDAGTVNGTADAVDAYVILQVL